MAETVRDRVLAALSEVLYIDESDLIDGDVDVLTNNAGVVAQHRNPILR